MSQTFTFAPATRKASKARIAFDGPSGSGKTYTALEVATGLAGDDGRIALIDTERGSASLYADLFSFDVLELGPPFSPARYIAAIQAAENAGYDVLVIDSLTHAWSGTGGVLEIVENASKKFGGNKWSGWSEGTPAQQKLIDAITNSTLHIIVTMRSKTEWVEQENDRGKKTYVRVGTSPEQRGGIEYEFSIVGDLDRDHNLIVSKSRLAEFQDLVIPLPDRSFGKQIREWLESGESVAMVSPAQKAVIRAHAKTLGYDDALLSKGIAKNFGGKTTVESLTEQEADRLIDILTDKVAEVQPTVEASEDLPFELAEGEVA